ncbi:type 1 periplasmic binding fold superfamily protein [Flavobacterium sp. HXWNR69]|uniref:Type 1 periplasmic binding fold superfamily protein n=1 Tax=Flavobacterium fragile TaxID=2949085 RepID=A0ABT0TI03_9FLAO|nr:type 1 periplasmic binding fold superfamily protein [Flavobacterium sp. HXWNR69]MCL9770609.1 type 1 periplasmic binding fold superfamily protein [Flavobacterium sp. HXWNR69]
MKNLKLIALLVIPTLFSTSCSNDDSAVNEDEVITTITTTLIGGGQTITLTSRDADGDGPNAPIVTVSGNLVAGTTYSGSTTFVNELANPSEDITEEIALEGADHQVFYQLPSTVGTLTYTDTDESGKPIGLNFTLVTGSAGTTGTLIVTLRHLPNKSASGVAAGDITNAGGNTDAAVTFPIEVN